MRAAPTPATDNVLRDSAFRKLLTSRLFAATAVQIQSVVVGRQLYGMTHSALTLGWVGLAQFLPMALLVLPAGDAADRLPRRALLVASSLTMALAALLFTGPAGLGALRSAVAIGAFAMDVYLGRVSLNRRAGPVMFLAVAVFGIGTIVFGLSTNFLLSFAALVVMGAADMINVFVRSTLIQLATPDAMRGRVNAVNMLFIGASNELGEFESGVTAAIFGTVAAVVIGGLGTLAVVGAWLWLFPALRRVDRLDHVGRQASAARA